MAKTSARERPGPRPHENGARAGKPGGRRELETAREPNALRRALKILGPGVITGASDSDPTRIGTFARAGASFGLATLWTALVVFPLLGAVQFLDGVALGPSLPGLAAPSVFRTLFPGAPCSLLLNRWHRVGRLSRYHPRRRSSRAPTTGRAPTSTRATRAGGSD